MSTKRICFILLLMVHAGSSADVYTGKQLLKACIAPANPAETEACNGWAEWGSMSPYFCVPEELDTDDLVAAMVEWFEAHANMLHMPGGALVHNALLDTFPCAD